MKGSEGQSIDEIQTKKVNVVTIELCAPWSYATVWSAGGYDRGYHRGTYVPHWRVSRE